MDYIDLRSDTVTKPTAEMREAMLRAEVGDDVRGEDPTTNRLQELASERFGKEAALFVPSGTMGNQICVRLHTEPGQEVILEERSHMFNLELAAMAVVSGTLAHTIRGEDGVVDWPLVEAAIRPRTSYFAQTGLVALENTLNLAGGTVVPLDRMEEICERAHERGIRVHLDGARIFNAALSLKKDVTELARPFDSVMFCLSKGLGAPVGSLILGSRAFIDRARAVRAMMGGAMRQAGILAAAGIVALTRMTGRLVEDHANARSLAEGISQIDGIALDTKRVQSNIVVFDIGGTRLTTAEFTARLKRRRVLANAIRPNVMRMVTHKDVSHSDCEFAIQAIRQSLSE